MFFQAPYPWLPKLGVTFLLAAVAVLGWRAWQRGAVLAEFILALALLGATCLCFFLAEAATTRTMRRQSRELRAFLSSIADVALILSHNGQILDVTESAARYGCDPAVMVGKQWFSAFLPNSHDVVSKMMDRLTTGASTMHGPVSVRLDLRNHSNRSFEAIGYRLTVGRYQRLVILCHDITERQQLHKQMAILDRRAAVAHLSASIAHNFNNVLGGIMLNAGLLADADGEEKNILIERVLSSAERGAKLCRKLITFARGESPAMGLVAVLPLLQDLVTLFETEARRYQVTVEISANPDLVLQGDRRHLQQILLNLLFNAREAIGSYGRIEVKASQVDKSIEITVSNSGPPIPPERIPLIFLPFYSTKTDNVQGTGMGLAVCQSLARGMGGVIEVESLPGLTTFSLVLPSVSRSQPRRPT